MAFLRSLAGKGRSKPSLVLISFLLLILCSFTVTVARSQNVKKFERKPVAINHIDLGKAWELSDELDDDYYYDNSLPEPSMEEIQKIFLEDSKKNSILEAESTESKNNVWPVVVNTWAFTEGAKTAWDSLASGGSALDAVERGCSRCEDLQCDYTVGYGGSPDENGETTLDAMIMDGETHASGAVGCLRRVKNAIGVARKVLEHTGHTLLVGELATEFAVKMGFPLENLTTDTSQEMHDSWKNDSCQPNFWRNVSPDPTTNCGPYSPISQNRTGFSSPKEQVRPKIDRFNHDTISMVVIDSNGKIASGSSSNGARNKIPGRVGDAPITGAGSYVDREVGGAGATGDGDIMARFLPSLLAVEEMRRGKTPLEAARYAISRVAHYYPNFSGAIVTVNLQGDVGAACHNLPNGFPYSFRTAESGPDVKVEYATCT